MTISKELYLALLSMDAYNRGYGAGIADGGTSDMDGLGEAGHIGNATLLTRADIGINNAQYDGWQAVGFYAVAYTMGSGSDVPPELQGKTIISYRGTDNYGALPNTADVWNGSGIALGSPLGEQARPIAAHPAALRAAVATSGIAPILTGHSLGWLAAHP